MYKRKGCLNIRPGNVFGRFSLGLVLLLAFCPLQSHSQNLLCAEIFGAVPSEPEVRTAADFFAAVSRVVDPTQFASKTYGEEYGKEVVNKLTALGPQFMELVYDLPLMSRLDSFYEFVKKNSLEPADPWTARDKFREQLGIRRVYRALAITESEWRRMTDAGIESNFVRLQGKAQERSASFKELADEGLLEILRDRFEYPRVKINRDIFLSVSDFAEMAVAAVSITIDIQHKKIFVFQIDLPEADLFAAGPKPFHHNAELEKRIHEGLGARVTQADGISHSYRFDSSIESFAVYNIPKSSIGAIYQVREDAVPKYESINNPGSNSDSQQSFLEKFTVRVR